MRFRYLGVLALLISSLCLGSVAQASHYELQDVQLVTPEIQAQMVQNGITDTEQLFAELLTGKQRKEFAQKYHLTLEQTEKLARLLELMQIQGVGPKAATLLMASGIQHLDALIQANPEELLKHILAINAQYNITGIQPDIIIIKDWIEKASNIYNKLSD